MNLNRVVAVLIIAILLTGCQVRNEAGRNIEINNIEGNSIDSNYIEGNAIESNNIEVNNIVSNPKPAGIGDIVEIKTKKEGDTGGDAPDLNWNTAEIAVNQKLIYNEDMLDEHFGLNVSDFEVLNPMRSYDDKYFYLLYMTIKNTDDEDLSAAVDLAFTIEGGIQPFEYDKFTFDLINRGKDVIIKSGESRDFIFPFVFNRHLFNEDLDKMNIGRLYLSTYDHSKGEALIELD